MRNRTLHRSDGCSHDRNRATQRSFPPVAYQCPESQPPSLHTKRSEKKCLSLSPPRSGAFQRDSAPAGAEPQTALGRTILVVRAPITAMQGPISHRLAAAPTMRRASPTIGILQTAAPRRTLRDCLRSHIPDGCWYRYPIPVACEESLELPVLLRSPSSCHPFFQPHILAHRSRVLAIALGLRFRLHNPIKALR